MWRAVEVDESRGFMKAIVDAESGQILGGENILAGMAVDFLRGLWLGGK